MTKSIHYGQPYRNGGLAHKIQSAMTPRSFEVSRWNYLRLLILYIVIIVPSFVGIGGTMWELWPYLWPNFETPPNPVGWSVKNVIWPMTQFKCSLTTSFLFQVNISLRLGGDRVITFATCRLSRSVGRKIGTLGFLGGSIRFHRK